jgi:hypothetical protein
VPRLRLTPRIDFPPARGVGEHRAVSDQPSAVERALDVCVFAPLGLALGAREVVPKLAAEGREQVQRQLTTARYVGEFAVKRLRRRADAALVELGLTRAQRAGPARAPDRPLRPDVPARAARDTDGNGQVTEVRAREPRVDASVLAIPGYDSLSASQVVQRLSGLSRAELEAVRAYEQTGRGRKTILTRVAQLQAAAG